MSTDTDSPNSKIHFDILKYIKKIQSRNGVRDNQYIRYRQYCTRRLHRVRTTLKLTTRSSKYIAREFSPRDYTSAEHLTIPLLNAERAWAYAMEMQSDLEVIEPERISAQRYHIVRRLAKAAKHAVQLEQICADVADDITHLQTAAYAAWLQGTYALNKEDWAAAIPFFSKAEEIFTQLVVIADLEVVSLCTERAHQVKMYKTFCTNKLKKIDPSASAMLAMQSGDTFLQAKLQTVLADNLKHQAETLTSISWRGREWPIKNEATRVPLVEARNLESQVALTEENPEAVEDEGQITSVSEFGKSALLSKVISAYDEALITIRADLREATNAKVKTEALEQGIESLQAISAAVTSRKLLASLRKNVLSATSLKAKFDAGKKLKKHKGISANAMCGVFDRLLLAVKELIELVGEDTTASNGNDVISKKSLELRENCFKTLRLYFLSAAYAVQHKYKEALALLQAAKARSDQYLPALKAVGEAVKEEVVMMEDLLQSYIVDVNRYKAYVAANEIQKEHAPKTSVAMVDTIDDNVVVKAGQNTLLDRLDTLNAGEPSRYYELGRIPPALTPAASKPFLFDLALQSVAYPVASLEARMPAKTQQQEKVEESAAQSKGFWGRLWG